MGMWLADKAWLSTLPVTREISMWVFLMLSDTQTHVLITKIKKLMNLELDCKKSEWELAVCSHSIDYRMCKAEQFSALP